jgi:hypothetical protein
LTALAALAAAVPVNVNPRAVGQIFSASRSTAVNLNDGIGAGVDVYKSYNGDGSVAAGWPAMSEWVSFQQMYVTVSHIQALL